MENDFWEVVQRVEDDQNYLPMPRYFIRDQQNPLERYSNAELLQRYRFTRNTIQNIILPMVYSNEGINDRRGLPVPELLKLCAALRFYATGSYQRVCGDLQNFSQSTMCRIVVEVSEQLAQKLQQYVKFPETAEDMAANRNLFYEVANFLGVVGCIDCTHIEIKSPGGPTAEVYLNRKSWMSLNVQVVAGPRYEILDIVIRWPGSAHDSRIFSNSLVKMKFEEGRLRGILLGDSAYPQLQYLYTPVPAPQTRAEQRYNSAHITRRCIVECTFEQWKQRFRCIGNKLNYKLRIVTRIIGATAVLHNIAINEGEPFVPDPRDRDDLCPYLFHHTNNVGT